jgi:hypothetical protein
VVDAERIMGQKSEVILLPPGRLKPKLTALVPDSLARLVTNRCRQGSFLITDLRKL